MLTATPLSFTFSCDFEYQGLHYRLRGQYSAKASAPQQSIRCIPLTLGKDLMEQGGYQKKHSLHPSLHGETTPQTKS